MEIVHADADQFDQSVVHLADRTALEGQVGPLVAGALEVVPGLVEVLAVPTASGWAIAHPDEDAATALTWEGARNRLAHDVQTAVVVPADVPDAWGALPGIRTASPHASGWLLAVEEMLRHVEGGSSAVGGAFVAAPADGRLFVLPCVTPDRELRGRVMRLPQAVISAWREATTPLSPHVYHWGPATGLRQVTRYLGERTGDLLLPDDVRAWLSAGTTMPAAG